MKKNERIIRDLEKNVVAGVATTRDWAAPHVDAAYGWAKPRWEKGLETAGPALHDTVRKASDGISGGIATVTPKIQDGIDKVGPRISHVIDDKAAPALNSAKHKVVDDYLPALSSKLGDAAGSASKSLAGVSVPPAVEKAVTKVTGDKKAVKKAQKRLAAATLQASKDLKKRQARKSGKGWLVFGILAAAAVAVVAAWRASKPVEDPWKTPAPVNAKPAPVSSQKSQEAKDVVAAIKEAADRASADSDDAKDKAADATKTAADKAKDVTENVKEKAADATKTAAEKAKDVTENVKDASESAKHAAKPGDDTKA